MKEKFIVIEPYCTGGNPATDFNYLAEVKENPPHKYTVNITKACHFANRAQALAAIRSEIERGSKDIYQIQRIYVCA